MPLRPQGRIFDNITDGFKNVTDCVADIFNKTGYCSHAYSLSARFGPNLTVTRKPVLVLSAL
jgi:hypothetical protein